MGNVNAAPVIVQLIEDDEIIEGRRHQLLIKRHLRDISDPFAIGEEQFRKLYRMTPLVAIIFIERLLPYLTYHADAVPPHLQVLSVVRFLAEGPYQKGLGNDYNHPMSQSTISKYLHIVIPAINQLTVEFIRFPGNRDERQAVSRTFEDRIGFPGVLGLLDCTLIRIHTPADHEEAYVDHNQDHSLNVQVVSDSNYNIMNVRICSGSTHDAFVWRFSEQRQKMIRLRQDAQDINEPHYFLLADSGYTQSPYLLTPINEAPEGSPEYRYSTAIRGERCGIEQTFGIWKEVCRCINGDRTLHYAPYFAAQIIQASAVFYNFLRHHGMPMPIPPRRAQRNNNFLFIDDDYQQGLLDRQNIINQHFQINV